jgi:superfamily II DNA or RNA helicase
MVFAAGVKHSIALCQQFQAAGITAEHVDGKTAKEVRDNVLARFKVGTIQVIVNCMIFTEGVDVPDIGCVVLARPTKSLVMYMQMVGRGMRAVAGKTDCILLDHAGAVHEHGFPDEITEWELSTSGKIVNKKHEQRKKKESEPISCPLCSLLYTKQMVCPNCGNIPTRDQFGKDIDYIDGALGEVVRKSIRRKVQTKPDRPIGPTEANCYRQLQRYALERNYKPGWVAHTFREIYGVWPDRYKHLPPAPAISADVAKYIKYSHIKHAKFVAKQVT